MMGSRGMTLSGILKDGVHRLVDLVLHHSLDLFGIRPWTLSGLVGILFAPLLLVSFGMSRDEWAAVGRSLRAVLQTLFLAGDIWTVILPNAAVLAVMAAGLMLLARVTTRKTLA